MLLRSKMLLFIILLCLNPVKPKFVQFDKQMNKYCDFGGAGYYLNELYLFGGKCLPYLPTPSFNILFDYERTTRKLDMSSLSVASNGIYLTNPAVTWQNQPYTHYNQIPFNTGEILLSSATPTSVQIGTRVYMASPNHNDVQEARGFNPENVLLVFDFKLKKYLSTTTITNFIPVESPPAKRICIMTDGKDLFVVGGEHDDFTRIYLTAVDSWIRSTGMHTVRRGSPGCAFNNDGTAGFMFGGYISSFDDAKALIYNTIEEYDPITKTWVSLNAIPGARLLTARARSHCISDMRPIRFNSKLIYCIGGVTRCDAGHGPFPCPIKHGHPLASVEVFDTVSKQIISHDKSIKLTTPRFSFGLVTFIHQPSGAQIVIVAGGTIPDNTTIMLGVNPAKTIEYFKLPDFALAGTPTQNPATPAPAFGPRPTTARPNYRPFPGKGPSNKPTSSPLAKKIGNCPGGYYVCYYNQRNVPSTCQSCRNTLVTCDDDNKISACAKAQNKAVINTPINILLLFVIQMATLFTFLC